MRATRRLATTIISWAAIAAAEPRVRVALQVSGHLRELCDSNAEGGPDNLAPLEALVAACRERAACDVFVHTWSTLDASTPTWHTPRPPDPRPSALGPYAGVDLSFEALEEDDARGAAQALSSFQKALGPRLDVKLPGIDLGMPAKGPDLPRRHGAPVLGLVAGVRQHGSYKRYARSFHRDVLVCRGLAQRGRLSTGDPVLNFLARLGDNGVVWHILGYWQATD